MSLCLLVACDEWTPVFTLNYQDPAGYERQTLTPTHTIAELAKLYKHGTPQEMGGYVIGGRVSTTDQPGNFYKSFYIQDETGGMEIKIGKNGLYNDYKEGQWVYVKCQGLTLGEYGYKTGSYGGNGMVQIGYADPTGSYETSYLEAPLLIDAHIIRGEQGEKVTPYVITSSSALPTKNDSQATNKYIGSLVTLKGLKYANEIFCLLYLDSSKDKTSYTNRVFLSDTNPSGDPTHSVTTWAMSKNKMTEYIESGVWDKCAIGSGNNYVYKDSEGKEKMTLGDLRDDGTYPDVEKAAYSVSQYFNMGSTEIQLRTSGYSKFADKEIPAEVLSGAKTVDITGVLTLYQGSIQLVVNSLSDIVLDGKSLE